MFAKVVTEGVGEGRLRVEAVALDVEPSTLIWILGGERPHIGAVAVAQKRPSLRDPRRLSCNVSVISLLGHKEEELVFEIAKRCFERLKKDVAIAIGVHVEKATDEEIDILVRNCRSVLSKLLDRLA